MKKKLENKEDFEKIKLNEKEKYLCEKKNLLLQDETHSLTSLKELEKVQEELIEISINEFNKNNLEKYSKE